MLFGYEFIYFPLLNEVKIHPCTKAPMTHSAPVTAAFTQGVCVPSCPHPLPFSFACVAQEANLELHLM